jgi:thiol:disulfide interchange protein DsbA
MTVHRHAPGSRPGQALRYTLLASVVLFATACTSKAPEETTTEATPASVASPAASEASSGMVSPASDASTTTPAASPAAPPPAAPEVATTSNIPPPKGMPAGPAPVQDTDYMLIDTPGQVSGDKIQVTEVFGYGCPHCNALQPDLSVWEKKLPSDVQFQYMPAAFGQDPNHCWDDFARAFYAAQAMGIQAKNHDAIYKAVWDEHRLATGCASIPGIFAKFGVDEKVFSSTMQSFAVNAKVSAAHEQVVRWGVDSTPTLVIDGKYKVIELGPINPDGSPRAKGTFGPENMLHTVDWLIAMERQAHAKH